MTQTVAINPYTWVNLSSAFSLTQDTVYNFKITGTLGYIAQLENEPSGTGQATQLTSTAPSINLKETAGLSIYALGSSASIISANEEFMNSNLNMLLWLRNSILLINYFASNEEIDSTG